MARLACQGGARLRMAGHGEAGQGWCGRERFRLSGRGGAWRGGAGPGNSWARRRSGVQLF